MHQLIEVSSTLAQQYFDLEIEAQLNEQQLLALLTKHISRLLDYDFQGLLNAMYRVDVEEAKFKLILSHESPEKLAPSLARLVLDRMMQKAEMRIKYKQ